VEVKSELLDVKKFDDLDQLPGTPLGWHTVFRRIEEQRKGIRAAVDMYGAEILSDKEKLEPKVSRYHTLLALMLSSQTRDEITHKAMMQLKEHGLTVENILKTPEADLAKLIYPVGFYNNKAKNILKASQMLKDKYDCDIPPTLEGLLELPGVGPKMAHLVMLIAWDKCVTQSAAVG
jgi:endonuclease III